MAAELSHSLSLSDQITLKDFNGHDLELTAISSMVPGTKVQWVNEDGVEEAKEPQQLLSLSGKVAGHADSFVVLNLSPKNSYGYVHIDVEMIRKSFHYDVVEPKVVDMDMPMPAALIQVGSSVDESLKSTTRAKHTLLVAIECDKSCNDQIVSRRNNVEVYLRSILTAVSVIYQRDLHRNVQISYIKIFQTNVYGELDITASLSPILRRFGGTMHRKRTQENLCFDIPLLFTGSGRGGLATLGQACKKEPRNAAVVSTATQGSTWDGKMQTSNNNFHLVCTLHEIGHVIGSPHTHDYDPPIDQCVECSPDVVKAKNTCGGSDV